MHFFDGFRTSHEVSKIEELTDDDLRALLSEDQVAAHRRRALTPDHPVLRGTAQNPDTFFQAREAANLFYRACPDIVEQLMARFAALTGRRYGLFEYAGHPEAERVIVIMGSGADTVHETVDYLAARGDKVGVLKVHLFRPFSIAAFLRELPRSVRAIAVMDRTKEPGALGEPLYQDVVTALAEARADGTSSFAAEPVVVGGRYGLSSKEFTPAMVKAIFDTLAQARPKNHFTVGIMDDVTHTSLAYDDTFDTEPADVTTALFYGLGADGTVGANKNSIKIIGEETDLHVQGYFVYDSKKAGATTVSHLRTSPRPIRSAYLISKARFVACHQFEFLERVDVLEHAVDGAVFLLNAPYAADEVWERLPREVQEQLIDKRIRFYTIDASAVARETGMGGRINTIMQTCFFAISGVLPREEAIAQIKHAIEKTYSKRGAEVVKRNFEAVDATLAHLQEVSVPSGVTATHARPPLVSALAPDFVQRMTAVLLAGKGDLLPVSAFPVDGTWPVGTAKWEKRNLALEIPVWDAGHLHPVQSMRAGVSARGHPGQGVRRRPARRRAADVQVRALQRARVQGAGVHDSGGAGGLHGLQPVRERLPGQGSDQPPAQGDRHAPAGAAPRRRAGQLRVLSRPARHRARRSAESRPQDVAVPRAAVRVLGGVRRVRRNAVHQAAHAALRRPRPGGERHGLLVDLRRQPADHAVHDQPRRARAGVVELAVRGQRGIRPRHAPRRGQSHPRGARAGGIHGRADRRAPHRANCSTPTSRRKRGSGRSASGCARCDRCSRRSPRPKRAASKRSPTTS